MEVNTTELGNDNVQKRSTYQTAIAVFFLLVIMVTGLVGNTAVIAVCCLQRRLRQEVSNLLIVNLSVTDLGNTVLVMASALVSLLYDGWPLGSFFCSCICALNYCLIIVSMLTLSCISIDRFQAVMHPLSYGLRVTRRRLNAIIIYTWIQGLSFGMAPSFLNWVAYDYWEAICAIQWHMYKPSSVIYVTIAFLLCFLGPGIVLIWCYLKILKEVKKQRGMVSIQVFADKKMQEKHNRKVSDRTKLIWSLITVVAAYFVCTTPFSVTKLIKVSVSDMSVLPKEINLVASLLGYVASAINPLIYGIFRRDFRKAYLQLLRSLFRCEKMADITSETMHCVTTISNANQVTIHEENNCMTVMHDAMKQLKQAQPLMYDTTHKQAKTVTIKEQQSLEEHKDINRDNAFRSMSMQSHVSCRHIEVQSAEPSHKHGLP
ncbi:octopamine receptor beta-2R-like isoform X2 [Mya arenaria]|nr:octopamine receptor beta-2R-like isoform X2 [Mya arenaria]XP_052769149.1 octopamine receptor beta-2R-like isoform X2 [Mya arenaria]XP_052769150.1 octopamine receptor beta-2R-like isoform X2 [Mya arenaria]XP_052769151.1 octopamine receptor beta-2R-like isoform X2 [Mya arenaria]